MNPNFDDFTFEGNVVIDLSVKDTSDSVTLNVLEITIKSVRINEKEITNIEYNEERQEVKFTLNKDQKLSKGSKAKIEIDYKGILNDQMAGFYRSKYTDANNQIKYLATTQFEATDARRAFPCFDEPEIKSHFQISLIADKELTTLANMLPEKEIYLGNGKKKVVFKSTPLLSTYLVAFIVGDLKYIENNDYKIPVRVYTVPGLEKQGEFSASIAAKTLQFFANAFDIEYYLPHMNMVAIPDFACGAMENLSLITYRDTALLVDDQKTSLAAKLRVAETVQHELAHQWFGNLVTMRWWNDLWLNESYATYCSYMAFEASKCDESFIWQNFEADNAQEAFQLDALRSSHPIEVSVYKAEEINQIFDAVSYNKGSVILRMLANWLGKDVFLKGVSEYLKKHKFSNAETKDLWESLSEVSGKDVLSVMEIWTKNIGYPVVTVLENGNTITLKQNRYLSTGDVKPEEDKVIYPIFLNLKTLDGINNSLTLVKREQQYELQDSEFFKINADSMGFYRTLYTSERWTKLAESGCKGMLSTQDRTHLVDDAVSLAISGHTSTENFLNLISVWNKENEYIVWKFMLESIRNLESVWEFSSPESADALKKFTRDFILFKLSTLNWEFSDNESPLDQRLKATIFSAAVISEVPEIIDYSKQLFKKYMAGDNTVINSNIKAAVFSAIAKSGGQNEYDQIMNVYSHPSSIDEKKIALLTLGKFSSSNLIAKTLEYAINPEIVRPQNVITALSGLRGHKEGILALWKWLQNNWDLLNEKFPPSLNMLSHIVSTCTSGYLVDGSRKEITEFFKNKSVVGIDKSLEQSLDTIETKYKWFTRDHQVVNNWLNKKGYK